MAPAVFLGLGSNLGEREAHLREAVSGLEACGFRVETSSSLYLTEPVGGPPQGWYLNAVVGGTTLLEPQALLEVLLAIERAAGRERGQPNGPRTLDLDLLLYGERVVAAPGLSVPHPRLHERRFVLVPLAEIAPAARHPQLGLSVQELLARCPDTSRVERQGVWSAA